MLSASFPLSITPLPPFLFISLPSSFSPSLPLSLPPSLPLSPSLSSLSLFLSPSLSLPLFLHLPPSSLPLFPYVYTCFYRHPCGEARREGCHDLCLLPPQCLPSHATSTSQEGQTALHVHVYLVCLSYMSSTATKSLKYLGCLRIVLGTMYMSRIATDCPGMSHVPYLTTS